MNTRLKIKQLGVALAALIVFVGVLVMVNRAPDDPGEVFEVVQFESSIRVKGAIAPHHLLTIDLIYEIFENLDGPAPKTIVILGPNHDEEGSGHAISSRVDWSTEFGVLQSDKETIFNLANSGLVSLEETVVRDEHSITTLLPFVKEYFPEASVIPIVLSSKHDLSRSVELGRELALLDEVLIIASVDFSHYLPESVADVNDELILRYLEDRDLQAISDLNSDYLDSPPAIIALFSAVEEMGATDYTVLTQLNSADILGSDIPETTSYITMIIK